MRPAPSRPPTALRVGANRAARLAKPPESCSTMDLPPRGRPARIRLRILRNGGSRAANGRSPGVERLRMEVPLTPFPVSRCFRTSGPCVGSETRLSARGCADSAVDGDRRSSALAASGREALRRSIPLSPGSKMVDRAALGRDARWVTPRRWAQGRGSLAGSDTAVQRAESRRGRRTAVRTPRWARQESVSSVTSKRRITKGGHAAPFIVFRALESDQSPRHPKQGMTQPYSHLTVLSRGGPSPISHKRAIIVLP